MFKAFFKLGGRRWIRTIEAWRNRFTVCPLWPLGNSPLSSFSKIKAYCLNSRLQWSWWTDLNPRPADYKSAALPTELHQRIARKTRLVTHRRFELRTPWLKVKCSTDWATPAYPRRPPGSGGKKGWKEWGYGYNPAPSFSHICSSTFLQMEEFEIFIFCTIKCFAHPRPSRAGQGWRCNTQRSVSAPTAPVLACLARTVSMHPGSAPSVRMLHTGWQPGACFLEAAAAVQGMYSHNHLT